tara:strand:+ start:4612 stop:7350 length:2739 start_codon:yes stop_codon:yes gene_type:complete
MPYLGRPVTNAGQFEIIDDISSGFDGSDVSFTLQVGGTDILPDASNVTIVLDGVVQIPSSAYSITGSTLNFSEAPADGVEFHGVLAGQSQFIESGFITNTHISDSANISGSKINTDFSAQTVKAAIFDGMVSGSAQLADDISGSFSKEHLGAKVANVVTSSAQIAADISGSFGNQRVGTSDSPTFAGGTVTGDFAVGGTLTAQEVHTEFESASILFTSGSTIFGNSSDDVHNMTGSLNISGSFGVNDGNVHIADKMIAGSGSGFGFGDTNHSFTVKSTGNNAGFSVLSSAGSELLRFIQESNDAGKLDIYDGGSLKLRLSSHANENNYINNGGKLGIGTNNPVEMLEVYNATSPAIQLNDGGDYKGIFRLAGNDLEVRGSSGALEFYNGSADGDSSTLAMTIDSSQRVAVGNTSPAAVGGYYAPKFSVEGDDYKGVISVIEHQNGISGGIVSIGKSRGTSAGAVTILQTDDITGRLLFSSADGVDFRVISAEIRTLVGASPAANDVPGHLLFMTNDGSGVDSTERMRIDSAGVLTTTSGSAVSTFTNQQKYYESSPDATHLIVNSPEEHTVTDSNANYKRMKTFIANRSGRIRVKWEGKNQSGTYYWSWRFSKNNGSTTDTQYPTLMTHPNGDNAQGSFAAGVAEGVSSSTHEYTEFDVALDGVVAGDQIELWHRSADGSGGQVTGNGQTLYAKNFEVYSDVPNAPKHVAHQYGFTLEDGNALFGTRSVTTTNVGGATFAPNSVGRTVLNLGSVNYTSEIDVVRLFNQNGEVGDIRTNGSGASFNSASDYRLKENEVTLSNALTRLNNLKPYRFNFKADSDTTLDGFFAHEVQDVVPEAVSGTKDQMKPIQYQPGDDIPEGKQVYDVKEYSTTEIDPQKLDASKLVPLMVAAIQELSAQNEVLTTKVEALEK